MIRKVLIPNRGEIAVRIIQTAHKMDIRTVVTLSQLEQDTLPAQLSDEVYYFEQDELSHSFLDVELIIQIAKQYDVDAIHPGYGFLSENEKLATACLNNHIIFVGPSPENLQLMGDKQEARKIAKQANIPLTKSYEGDVDELLVKADSMPYPVLIKAAMGGGGKGMTRCHNKLELTESLEAVSRQAASYFGDGRIYVEQYIPSPRHIEVQVLADQHGHTIHLFERECSIQRRYQKIIEEAPAPGLSEAKRTELTNDAIKLCKAINYSNAGTIEFLVDASGRHYFLEMNTRIQVEHPVTEAITGIDIVEWQFRIANGEKLTLEQSAIQMTGHAIEARLYAEDPEDNFKPSPGEISLIKLVAAQSIRIEMGFDQPITVHPHYDPMIAKFIAHNSSRAKAIGNLKSFLEESVIHGIITNASYLIRVLSDAHYLNNLITTHYCSDKQTALIKKTQTDPQLVSIAYLIKRLYKKDKLKGISGHWRLLPAIHFLLNEEHYTINYEVTSQGLHLEWENQNIEIQSAYCENNLISFKLDNTTYSFHWVDDIHVTKLIYKGESTTIKPADQLPPASIKKAGEKQHNGNALNAPLPGQVLKIHVSEGQPVKKGDLLLVLEAMKMENHLKAWKDGVIEKIHIKDGHQVKSNQLLITTN